MPKSFENKLSNFFDVVELYGKLLSGKKKSKIFKTWINNIYIMTVLHHPVFLFHIRVFWAKKRNFNKRKSFNLCYADQTRL